MIENEMSLVSEWCTKTDLYTMWPRTTLIKVIVNEMSLESNDLQRGIYTPWEHTKLTRLMWMWLVRGRQKVISHTN